MGVLPDWFEQHWANYKHERLYAWVRTEARGAGEVEATATEMAEFAALMVESVDDVERALVEAGVSWQGLAAESMDSGVSPLAQWARDAAAATEASVDSARQVGDSFDYVSRFMPEPVPTPDRELTFPPSVADLVAAQQDHDATERAAQEAKLRAVELMDTYSGTSAAAADTLGVFVPPQGVTVATPAPPGGSAGSAFGSIDGSGGRDFGDREPGGPGGSGERRVADHPGGGVTPGPGSVTDPSRVTVPQTPGHLAPVAGSPAPTPTGPPTAPPVFVGGPGGSGPRSGPGSGPGGRGASGTSGGGQGRGSVGGGPGVNGRGLPGRGAAFGTGQPPGEPVAATRGGAGVGSRPGAPTGFGPMGAAQRGEEDKERTSPDYLRDYRDDFWDDTPPVAPAVIGEDEDDY